MRETWKQSWVGAIVAMCMVVGLLGCGSKTPEAPPAPERNQITSIDVTPGPDGVEVAINGTSVPDAKIYKLTDPVRLVVDIANSDVSAISPTIASTSDMIEEITVNETAAGAIARVQITLTANALYESREEGNALVVSIKGGEGGEFAEEPPAPGADDFAFEEDINAEGETAAAEDDPFAAEADPFAAEEDPFASEEDPFAAEGDPFAEEAFSFEEEPAGDEFAAVAAAPAAATTENAGPATTVTSVSVNGDQLVITADGEIQEHDSFTLDNPERLVIDLPNLTNGTGSESADVSSATDVNSVVISELPDRVRIIVEHQIPNFEANVARAGNQVTAGLGVPPAAPVAEAAPAAEEDFFASEEAPAEEASMAMAEEPAAEEPVDDFFASEPAAEPAAETAMEEAPAEDDLGAFDFDSGAGSDTAAVAAYPVAAADTTPEKVVRVTGVDFLPGKETTSVKISYAGDLQTEVVDSADTEVTVRVLNATLSQDLIRALDTSRYVGPVSMVKSFVEAVPAGEQGRVVIALRERTPYELRREDGALYLDFPTKSAAKGVAEAAPAGEAAAPSVAVDEVETNVGELETFDIGSSAAEDVATDTFSLAGTPAGELDSGQTYQGRKISLEFREADIRDVLQLIAEVSQLNIIAAADVQGTVSITLKNVPWDQALDIILETNGLGKKVIGNVIRIAPAEQLAAEEEARLAAQQTQEQLEPLAFQIVPVNYADAGDLQPRIQEILSPRGTVTVDERTNALLIKDIRRSIDQAIETVRALDTQTGQVLIESRIVTTTLTFARELGVQWGGRFLSSPSVGNNLGNNVIQNNFLVDLPVTGVGQRAGSSMGFSFGTLSDAFNLDVVLSAVETSGQGRLVASPRISVLDNKEAEIKTGISVPITTVQGGTISTTFVEAVLGVKVKPQITSDNSVIMDLDVFDNTINVAIPTAFGNPAINKNEANTELLVRDGHTVVIGGIVRVQDGFNEIAVPYFNKIPFLGYMFRTREWSDERQEILIFMTPQIVRN
ncbi:MAG: type IV pilus secretin PilQ [Chrysiogenetes bacterium]|nr:type IV pilus secretin PilQ [Chrysiogenetes bacterium]